MFKKTIFVILAIIVCAIAYWLISPFFIVKEVSEAVPMSQNSLEQQDGVTTVLEGEFVGFDRLHQGSGSAIVLVVDGKKYLRFEENFSVSNGPDLYVGFGKDGVYVKGSELGRLKGTLGSQNYELPDNFDIAKFNEVWVWCKAFSVGFAKAELK